MKLRHAPTGALLFWSFLSSAQAALFDFSFTFSNRDATHAGGTVTGIVRGLTDNATSAASSVEITSNSDGFGLGEYRYFKNLNSNSWTMSGGVITDYYFYSFGSDNTLPVVTCCSLILQNSFALDPLLALFNDPNGGSYDRLPTSISFTRLQTSVPEPDAFWLVAACAAAFIARVRKSRRSGARMSIT